MYFGNQPDAHPRLARHRDNATNNRITPIRRARMRLRSQPQRLSHLNVLRPNTMHLPSIYSSSSAASPCKCLGIRTGTASSLFCLRTLLPLPLLFLRCCCS